MADKEEAIPCSIICGSCGLLLPATFFHRYKNKKSGEFRRLKRCNACRQKDPKRPDLSKKMAINK